MDINNIPHKNTGDQLTADEFNAVVDTVKTKADKVAMETAIADMKTDYDSRFVAMNVKITAVDNSVTTKADKSSLSALEVKQSNDNKAVNDRIDNLPGAGDLTQIKSDVINLQERLYETENVTFDLSDRVLALESVPVNMPVTVANSDINQIYNHTQLVKITAQDPSVLNINKSRYTIEGISITFINLSNYPSTVVTDTDGGIIQAGNVSDRVTINHNDVVTICGIDSETLAVTSRIRMSDINDITEIKNDILFNSAEIGVLKSDIESLKNSGFPDQKIVVQNTVSLVLEPVSQFVNVVDDHITMTVIAPANPDMVGKTVTVLNSGSSGGKVSSATPGGILFKGQRVKDLTLKTGDIVTLVGVSIGMMAVTSYIPAGDVDRIRRISPQDYADITTKESSTLYLIEEG